jgi:hypothetical protein
MLSGMEAVSFTLGVMATNGDTNAVNQWQNASLRTANFDQPAAKALIIPVQFTAQAQLLGPSKIDVWDFMNIANVLPDVANQMKAADWYMLAGHVKIGHSDGGRPDEFVGLDYAPIVGTAPTPVMRSSFYGYSTGVSFYPVVHNKIVNDSPTPWGILYSFSGSILTYNN